MKRAIGAALTAGLTALSTMALAQSGEEVVKSKGCLGCHSVDQKKVGPPFREVSASYKGNKKAETQLIGMLKRGKGHVRIQASDAELKAAVQYVLGQ